MCTWTSVEVVIMLKSETLTESPATRLAKAEEPGTTHTMVRQSVGRESEDGDFLHYWTT